LPDDEHSLKEFLRKLDATDAASAASFIEGLFERPAFQTPIHQESNLPDFKQAIADTIAALNTGIWRDREKNTIARGPSIQSFSDANVVKELGPAPKP